MNLKTAARRLGVHYQTAYKWVRRGDLVAVKVGLGYEISEAAVTRFQARRDALGRVVLPADGPGAQVELPRVEPRVEALRVLDGMLAGVVLDARPVFETAVRHAAIALGDAAWVRFVSEDGEWLEMGSVFHPDPARFALIGSLTVAGRQRADQGFAAIVLGSDRTLHLPHVPRDQARAVVVPEFHQYLEKVGVHSLIVAPVRAGGVAVGAFGVSRDQPGRPYTTEDREFVEALAQRVSDALDVSRRVEAGWRARAAAKTRIEATLASGPACAHTAGPDVPALADLLGDLFSERDFGIVTLDPSCRFVTVSPRFAEMAGRSPEALAGQCPRETMQPDERAAAESDWDRLLAGELDFVDRERHALCVGGPEGHWIAHRAIVRYPDATPYCVIDVVTEAAPRRGASGEG